MLVAMTATLLSVGPVDAQNQDADRRRSFYLTKERFHANEALQACVAGYHMASAFEILDPSNLKYDTTLGLTTDDSGAGPPALNHGYVRTGFNARTDRYPGRANCNNWTSTSATDHGTTMLLDAPTLYTVTVDSPWNAYALGCDAARKVWCVQDSPR